MVLVMEGPFNALPNQSDTAELGEVSGAAQLRPPVHNKLTEGTSTGAQCIAAPPLYRGASRRLTIVVPDGVDLAPHGGAGSGCISPAAAAGSSMDQQPITALTEYRQIANAAAVTAAAANAAVASVASGSFDGSRPRPSTPSGSSPMAIGPNAADPHQQATHMTYISRPSSPFQPSSEGAPAPFIPSRMSAGGGAFRASDPGGAQRPPLAATRGAPLAMSRLMRNASSSGPPPPPPGGGDAGLPRSRSSGPVVVGASSSNDSHPSSLGGNAASLSGSGAGIAGMAGSASTRGRALLAAAAAARSGVAASPSLRRQASGGGASVTFSDDPGSTGSGGSHVLAPYGDGGSGAASSTHGGRAHYGSYDRAWSDNGGGGSGNARRRGWLRGLLCFGGGGGKSPPRLAGYQGQDDLAVVAKERREAQQLRKSTSPRLSKALSDTLMVRSSRPVAAAWGAVPGLDAAGSSPGGAPSSPAAAAACGAGRGARKLQPMLSLQPQKSCLKSSSVKRRQAQEAEPVMVKVASARRTATTLELTASAASAADGAAAAPPSEGRLGVAVAVMQMAAAMTAEEDGGASGAPPHGLSGGYECDPHQLEEAAVAVGGARGGAGRALTLAEAAAAEEAAGTLAAVDGTPSQARSVAAFGGACVVGPNGAGAGAGSGGSGDVGWLPDPPGHGGAGSVPSPGVSAAAVGAFAGGGGGGLLRKSLSLQHTPQMRLLGAQGPNGLLPGDAAAGPAAPGSGTGGLSGHVLAVSASNIPNVGSGGGGSVAAAATAGGEAPRLSLVHRMLSKQPSRGAGGSLGGGGAAGAGSGSGSAAPSVGRLTPRNAVRPLPTLAAPAAAAGGFGAEDRPAAAGGEPLTLTLTPQPQLRASFRRIFGEDSAAPAPAPGSGGIPSLPSSAQDSPPRRRALLVGRSRKLAAGVAVAEPDPDSEQDAFGNPLYGKLERATAPARQLREAVGGALAAAAAAAEPPSESPTPVLARSNRRVTTGGLARFTGDESDGEDADAAAGDGGGVAAASPRRYQPAGSESGRWRLQVAQAIKAHSSEPSDVQFAPSATVAKPSRRKRGGRAGGGREEDEVASSGELAGLMPPLTTAAAWASRESTRRQRAPTAGAGPSASRASLLATAAASSSSPASTSSSSLDGYMESIANSLAATERRASQTDDPTADADSDASIIRRGGAGAGAGACDVGDDGGGGGGNTPRGGCRVLDSRQARRMVARELLRMRSMGLEPGVLVAHLEAEAGQEAAPPQPQQQAAGAAAMEPDAGSTSATATAAATSAAAAAAAAATSADAAASADAATTAAESTTVMPPSRFRLTKFYSLGGGAPRASGGYGGGLGPTAAVGLPLTAAMLRASAEVALENARRISGGGGGTANVLVAADGCSAGARGPARVTFAAAPCDSLESWVRHQSRRCAGATGPLGPVDSLDELREVTGFGAAAEAAPPPPLLLPGEPAPAAMPFRWTAAGAVGSESLQHRGARLSPEPEVLQLWLHRNDRPLAEQEGALQRQRQPGGGAALPVMRQSLPGNIRQ